MGLKLNYFLLNKELFLSLRKTDRLLNLFFKQAYTVCIKNKSREMLEREHSFT